MTAEVTSLRAKKQQAPVKTAPIWRLEGYPNSYFFEVEVKVNTSLTLEQAIKDGAPNSEGATIAWMNSLHAQFPNKRSGIVKKKVLFVCFGQFINYKNSAAECEKIIASMRKKNVQAEFADIRTVLACGDYHRTLCREKNIPVIRMVSMASKLTRFNVTNVCVLHQKNNVDTVSNKLMFEPLEFGWSAEHAFLFEHEVRL